MDELIALPCFEDPPEEIGSKTEFGSRDFWIISKWSHFEHRSLTHVKAEWERLHDLFPESEFRIYHCKRNMKRSQSGGIIQYLCGTIAMLLAPDGQGPKFAKRIELARAALAKFHRPKP